MGRSNRQDVDRVSIEELAAALESRIGGEGRERADDDVALDERDSREPAREASAPALPHILIAHANPDVRGAVRAALARHFNVLEVDDGEDAWETLAAHRDVRVLITGSALPRLEGIGLIRRLRRPNGPSHLVGLPIMVYADHDDPAAKQTALLAGANDYLTTGTEPADTLLARVQARNRLFEQSRRAMNLTGTMPTSKAGRVETSDGSAATARVGRSEIRAPGTERPIWVEARGGSRSVPAGPRGWAERLYRISSTTTITLTATVLVILAITLILLLNQTPQRPQSLAVGRLDTAAPVGRAVEEKAAPAEETDAGDSRTAASVGTDQDPTPPPKPAPTPKDEQAAQGASVPTSPPAPTAERSRAETANVSRAGRSEPVETRRPAAAEPQSQGTRPPSESAAPRSATQAQAPAVAVPPKNVTSSAAPPTRETASAPRAEEPKPAVPESRPAPAVADTAKASPTDTAKTSPKEAQPAEDPPLEEPPALRSEPPPADTSVAAAPAPVAAPPPRPAPARLSRDELSSLLQRFVYVYEAGDIEQFMALLADNVQTNDRVTRQAVREDYDRLFRTTDLRQMRVDSMSWDLEGEQAHGWGEFEVRVRRQGDAAVHHYQGSLTVLVRKTGGRPRIERLYHSERRASR